MKKTVIVGARGSLLSVCQTRSVIRLLRKKAPGVRFSFRAITTLGDRVKQWRRQDTGIFVKELEDALRRGTIDMAVHSVKDLPSVIPPGLELAALLRREDPRDVLITRGVNNGIEGLAPGSVVGTTSLRRRAQLLRLRPDLTVRDLRGNLDTRIRKLGAGMYDAIIVAAAGLERLKIKRCRQRALALDRFLPSCGQGALGIEIRADDARMRSLVRRVEHAPTRACVSAERAFLFHTQAGCRMPVASFAALKGKRLTVQGMVISLDGRAVAYHVVTGNPVRAGALGKRLAGAVLARGGTKILKEIRRAYTN